MTGQCERRRLTIRTSMSALFFKRFLQKPFQIASIMPSSKALVERVAQQNGFQPSRALLPNTARVKACIRARSRAACAPDAQLLLFELDPAFSRDLERQFADDPRVHVINQDAAVSRRS